MLAPVAATAAGVTHDVCLFTADRQVYAELVALGVITPREEVTPPTVPMDYNWARVRPAFSS